MKITDKPSVVGNMMQDYNKHVQFWQILALLARLHRNMIMKTLEIYIFMYM